MRFSDLPTRLSKKWLLVIAVVLVGLTGVIDQITGAEIQVAVLYLVPVALVTWYVNRGAGFTIAVLSSVVWLVVQYSLNQVYNHLFVVFWNATGLLCFFLLFAILLAKIHATLYRIKKEVHDRLEVEAALARSEELYRSLVETAGDVMWAVDLNLKYTYVSPSVTKLLGYTVEEIMASDPLEGLTPASRDKVLLAFRQELENEYPNPREKHVSHSVEVERYHKDGTTRWIQYNATFLRDTDRLPIGILGISRDITERKKAEEALLEAHDELERRVDDRTHELMKANEQLVVEIGDRQRAERALEESLAQFRTLVEQIPAITYAAASDEPATVLYVSPQVQTFLGISPEDFKTDPQIWRKRLHPDDRERVLAEFRRSRETGKPFSSEYRMISADDRILWFHDDAVLVRGENGQPLFMQGVMLDITDAKRAEAALRESEERFRTVFEAAQDCIFIKNRDLQYTAVNAAMLDLLEIPASGIIGHTFDDVYEPDGGRNIKNEDLRVLRGHTVESEFTFKVGGREVAMSCVKFPLRDPIGTITELCGIARDMTDRRPRTRSFVRDAGQYRSSLFVETLKQVEMVAKTDSTVLFLGESGSGKDYLANALHRLSLRAGGPFFTINCAAVPPELAESELFGHEAGAFTGAARRKRGLLEVADGGTLLLNEIGDLPPQLQAKILTFLDTQSFTRLGGEKIVSVNTRVVAATNRDLEKDAETGNFRQDLFFRLKVFAIKIPPLRERIEDLALLVSELLDSLGKKMGLRNPPLADTPVLQVLSKYAWPGNVRELRNVLERALIVGNGDSIRVPDLGDLPDKGKGVLVPVQLNDRGALPKTIRETKRTLVIEALQRSKGSIKKAALMLGISRDSLTYLMKTLRIPRR